MIEMAIAIGVGIVVLLLIFFQQRFVPIREVIRVDYRVDANDNYSVLRRRVQRTALSPPTSGSGYLTFEANCRGTLRAIVIPEANDIRYIEPPVARVRYPADGFVVLGRMWKIRNGLMCRIAYNAEVQILTISTYGTKAELDVLGEAYVVDWDRFGASALKTPPTGSKGLLVV